MYVQVSFSLEYTMDQEEARIKTDVSMNRHQKSVILVYVVSWKNKSLIKVRLKWKNRVSLEAFILAKR